MQVCCTLLGQRPRLEDWEKQPIEQSVEAGPRPGDRRDAFAREVAQEKPGPPDEDGPFRRAAVAIRAFRIFPPGLATPVLRRIPVEVGDTVGLSYPFLPGVNLFFASRVVACFDGRDGDLWRSGFTYRTLAGHPETGEETFSVEKDQTTGCIVVALRSWSRPGLFLTWATAPVARWCQVQANRSATAHLAAQACGRIA